MKTITSFLHRPGVRKITVYLLVFCLVNIPVLGAIPNQTVGVSTYSGGADATVKINSGIQTTVQMNALQAILEWKNLNADPGELLQFIGKDAGTFYVLNRVNDAVNFNGILNGNNGHIFVVSPNGVLIGPDAAITASRFVASGLNLSDSDFMSGHYQFVPFDVDGAKIIGTVTNEGRIGYNPDGTANPVHDVALLGSRVLNKGAILADGGLVLLASGDEIFLASEGSNVLVSLYETPAGSSTYNVTNDTVGKIENSAGTVVLAAGDTFAQAIAHIDNKAYTVDTYTASQRGHLNTSVLEIGAANQADIRSGSTTSATEVKIGAKKVLLEDALQSTGDMMIDADFDINALGGLQSHRAMTLKAETVQVRGDITSDSTVSVEADTLYSRGDIISEEDLILMAESVLWGQSDQTIASQKSVKSTDAISKITEGELYISASKDVQLDGDVAAVQGGVSVVAENGKIHSGDGTDALNVAITGYSNDITDSIGVELPDNQGRAAIVLQSHDTLKLGPDASLAAEGFYLSANDDPVNGADDRTGMMWLADDGEIIGGYERDEGIASDVAIYVGSQTGNVEVATSKIQTAQPGASQRLGRRRATVFSGPATVVFDAFKAVVMPELETISESRNQEGQEKNFLGFRLEVGSRVTEWLHQAVQNATLPYADDPTAVEAVLGQDYVLRGAGLDNPAIEDGRAWVLEDLPVIPAVPLADLEQPELKGCPAEMQAAAKELDINSDDLQLLFNNSMATNPNLQPCDACARLLISAGALRDEDKSRLTAMIEIFNTLAPADAPFTEEVSASIATAFADLADQDPQYALANDYIDSFVDYIAVLDDDLKAPVGDPLVYTLNKYGEAVMSNPNQNIVTFLVKQVQIKDNSL